MCVCIYECTPQLKQERTFQPASKQASSGHSSRLVIDRDQPNKAERFLPLCVCVCVSYICMHLAAFGHVCNICALSDKATNCVTRTSYGHSYLLPVSLSLSLCHPASQPVSHKAPGSHRPTDCLFLSNLPLPLVCLCAWPTGANTSSNVFESPLIC